MPLRSPVIGTLWQPCAPCFSSLGLDAALCDAPPRSGEHEHPFPRIKRICGVRPVRYWE